MSNIKEEICDCESVDSDTTETETVAASKRNTAEIVTPMSRKHINASHPDN